MKQINIFLVILIFIMALIPFLLPSNIDENSSYEINAPIGLVYDEFSDLEDFSEWEMLTEADSLTLKKVDEGKDKKDFLEWTSKSSKIGHGTITIENTEINKSINYKINYENWEGEDDLIVNFEPTTTGSTKLNIKYLSQKVPYFYRYFLFFNSPIKKIDASIEKLDNLVKVKLEKERKEGNLIYGEFKVVHLPKYALMAMKKITKINDNEEVAEKAQDAFEVIYKYLSNDENEFEFDLGFPSIYKTEENQQKENQTIFAGVNLIEDVPLKGGIIKVTIPEGDYLLTLHQGPTSKRKKTIKSMQDFAKSKNIELGIRELEVLLNDPKETDSLMLKSQIYIPIIKSK